jgi:transcriptional regulator with XRE-family HTH domain
MNPNRKEFSAKLKRLIVAKGWSQSDLSRAASKHAGEQIGRHIVSAYIRGACDPSERFLIPIAKALDVAPGDLYSVDGDSFDVMFDAISGRARIVADVSLPAETASAIMKILTEGKQKDTKNV